jgi:hypothetical protein
MTITFNFREITIAKSLIKSDNTTPLIKSEINSDNTTPLIKSEIKSYDTTPLIKSTTSFESASAVVEKRNKLRATTRIFDDEFSCAVLMYHFMKIKYTSEDGFKQTLSFEAIKFLVGLAELKLKKDFSEKDEDSYFKTE